jgi:putative Mn2+ efflux pump MntP
MSKQKNLLDIGIGLLIIAAAIIGYVTLLMPAYGGYSGGGMSGLPAAFALILAFILLFVGVLLLLAALVIHLRKKTSSEH